MMKEKNNSAWNAQLEAPVYLATTESLLNDVGSEKSYAQNSCDTRRNKKIHPLKRTLVIDSASIQFVKYPERSPFAPTINK